MARHGTGDWRCRGQHCGQPDASRPVASGEVASRLSASKPKASRPGGTCEAIMPHTASKVAQGRERYRLCANRVSRGIRAYSCSQKLHAWGQHEQAETGRTLGVDAQGTKLTRIRLCQPTPSLASLRLAFDSPARLLDSGAGCELVGMARCSGVGEIGEAHAPLGRLTQSREAQARHQFVQIMVKETPQAIW